ncbi:MAG TPA: hypothetical protein G4O11_13265 [Anaerolineae bacterium]|nr:hypothetical protein [Anaerolineae bacterium]
MSIEGATTLDRSWSTYFGEQWLRDNFVVQEKEGVTMCNNDEQNDHLWGARINKHGRYGTSDCPKWANPREREKWEERGLILWDHESEQITRLWAGQALQLLEHFRTTDDWKQHGVIVGEPATVLYINDPEKEPEDVLDCQFELNPIRAQEVFDLLQKNEATLEEMNEREEEERSRALNNCYKILFGEEVWDKLARFYEVQPEEAIKAAQELLAIRFGKS